MVLRCQQLQRVAGDEVGVAVGPFPRRHERRQRRLPHALRAARSPARPCRTSSGTRRRPTDGRPRRTARGPTRRDRSSSRSTLWPSACASSVSSSSNSAGSVEAHRAGQAPEQLGVAARLAERRDRRLVPAHPEVAPRRHDVARLELRRRRQHDVGVAGRVGEELLVDDGEQVVARQPAAGQLGVGHDHERVAVPHDQRVDRRIERRVGERPRPAGSC